MTTKTGSNGKAPQVGTAVQNGNDKKLQTAASNSTTTVTEEGKLNASSENPQISPLSVEDKIQRVFSINELIEKRERVKNHLLKVDALKFDDFDEKNIITITAPNNIVYTIKSGYLCSRVAAVLKEELTVKVKEVETEFNRQVREMEAPLLS